MKAGLKFYPCEFAVKNISVLLVRFKGADFFSARIHWLSELCVVNAKRESSVLCTDSLGSIGKMGVEIKVFCCDPGQPSVRGAKCKIVYWQLFVRTRKEF